MPPHGGGHGGGHRGGGHRGGGGRHGGHGGGHHGHHHGRRGRGGGFGPGIIWGGPWYGNDGYSELIIPQCPSNVDPVLATDGRVYDNECLARTAGVSVVRRVAPSKLAEYFTIGDVIPGVPNVALLAGAGIAAFLMMRRKRR